MDKPEFLKDFNLSPIVIIAAMAKNRVIGHNNTIPWKLPEDMINFKKMTEGSNIIMGRKTWESLPNKPLINRNNFVITRQDNYKAPGAIVFNNLKDALAYLDETRVTYIIGGAEIYKEALPLADRLFITDIDIECEGDAYFPEFKKDWKIITVHNHVSNRDRIHFSYTIYERR